MHRILIIDDNQAIHADFRKILMPRETSEALASAKAALFGGAAPASGDNGPKFELVSAMQGQSGLESLREALAEQRPFSVAFVDMRMPPGWDGLITIERLWAVDPHLQVVICSAYSDHSWEDITRNLGLTDRLLILKKPFDPAEVSQIATALSEKWSLRKQASLKMDELERLVEQRTRSLAHAALHDKLTGLPNRALLRDRVAAVVEAGTPFALLFLDFDRFKVINDTLGHDAGDQFLVEIGTRLRSALVDQPQPWEGSLAARLGGDEFIVLATGAEARDGALAFGKALLRRLAQPYTLKGYNLTTSASIGITSSERSYTGADEAIRDADIAMYHAKAAGKARCVVFDQRMHQELADRLALETDLRGAASRGELVLHYQPIITLDTRELHGFEALVRWNHPVRGLVMPGQFIPAAEETGEIRAIGAWVLGEACRQLAAWRSRYPRHAHLTISVNTSAKQLSTEGLVGTVQEVLAASGLPPSALAIEITESAVIDDPVFATGILRQLADVGVPIHMDDFGTGYTSFSYLHKLPLNVLKLDRAFMNGVTERRDYAAIVHAVVMLAHNLGITVVAEGVETMNQVATLLAIECDFGQGYLFGKPVDAAETEALLSAGEMRVAA